MVERLRFNETQIKAVREIGREALDEVTKLYGEGIPTWKGVMKYRYHNRHHTYMTGTQGRAIAQKEGLGSSGEELTEVIGFSHDIIYSGHRGQDERESAAWIEERLRLRGIFPKGIAEMASLAIVGTEPIFDKEGNLIDQRVNRMEFPSRYAERVAKSVSSGDMGELLSSLGPFLSRQFYAELEGTPFGLAPPLNGLLRFQERQINLLQNYKYPLGKVAERVVDKYGLRPRVITYQKHIYDRIKSGDLETWDDIISRDLHFAKYPYERLT